MPWYYAGPDTKPVGPVSLEELHTRKVGGIITPETYVIEHTGTPNEPRAWKRYREVFPSAPNLPPLPPLAASPLPVTAPPPPTPTPPPVATPHPLFPSASAVPTPGVHYTPPRQADPYYNTGHKTNTLCAWGFGLGLASPFCVFCVIGLFMALISIGCCIMGISQLHKNREQTGRGLAISGILASILALIVALALSVALVKSYIQHHASTITEQTSNDSE